MNCDRRAKLVAATGLLVANLLLGLELRDKGLVMTEEGVVLTEASALLQGAVLYRDIDAWVTPGVWYLTAVVFKLAGPSLDATRWVMLLLSLLTTAVVFAITTGVSSWRWGLLAGGLVLVQRILAFPAGSFIWYTEFAILFALLVAWCLLRYGRDRRTRWLVLTGVCVASSFLFKQNIGVALAGATGLLLLAYHRGPKELGIVMGCGAAVVAPSVAYFALAGAMPDMIRGLFYTPFSGYQGGFTLSYLPPLMLRPLSGTELYHYLPALFSQHLFESGAPGFVEHFLPLVRGAGALLYLLPILIALVLALRLARRQTIAREEVILGGVALVIFFTVYPRPDFLHVAQGAVGFFPLCGCLLQRARSSLVKVLALAAMLVVTGVSVLLLARASFPARLDHPRAHVSLSATQHSTVTRTLEWMSREIPSDVAVMVAPYGAMYYFLSGRHAPHRYTLTMAPNIAFDGGRDAVEQTKAADVRFVVYLRRRFPGAPSLREHGPALYDYLEGEFEVVSRVEEPLGEQLRIIERREIR